MTTSKNIIAPFVSVLSKREARIDGLYTEAYTTEEMQLLEKWDNEVSPIYNKLVAEETTEAYKNAEKDEFGFVL